MEKKKEKPQEDHKQDHKEDQELNIFGTLDDVLKVSIPKEKPKK